MSPGLSTAIAGMKVEDRRPSENRLLSRLVSVGAALALTLAATLIQSPEALAFTASAPGMETIRRTQLPPQGQAVLTKIENGETFQHAKDGSVFGNRERLLPTRKRRFYREYTVPTPGLNHRGARRIVCGGETPQRPEACYYTEDHYASFRLIVK